MGCGPVPLVVDKKSSAFTDYEFYSTQSEVDARNEQSDTSRPAVWLQEYRNITVLMPGSPPRVRPRHAGASRANQAFSARVQHCPSRQERQQTRASRDR